VDTGAFGASSAILFANLVTLITNIQACAGSQWNHVLDRKVGTMLQLTLGERVTMMLLLNTFEGDRTSSVMRKTKRVKHAIKYAEIPDGAPISTLLNDQSVIDVELDKETLGWVWDLFTKFNKWPTQLDEWVETLEDKLRAALAVAAKSA